MSHTRRFTIRVSIRGQVPTRALRVCLAVDSPVVNKVRWITAGIAEFALFINTVQYIHDWFDFRRSYQATDRNAS